MKHKLLCAAAALAITGMSAPAFAQAAPDVLPPHEVVTIVRSTGLNPVERPVRRGNTYVFRAVTPAGQEMRVTVDARYGDVMSVAPVASARPGPLPPPGMTMNPYGRASRDRDDDDAYSMRLSPPGLYGSRQPALPEVDDDDDVVYAPPRPQPPGMIRPPAPVTATPLPPGGQPAYVTPQRAPAAGPSYIAPPAAPVPQQSVAVGEPQQIMQPQAGEGGLLPPPPERFPQRAAPVAPAAKPAAKPKPAPQTASAVPPKPPLPKAKPAAAATAPAPPAAAPPPATKPAEDDVPH